MVEFVRDVRSSDFESPEDFDVFAIDCGADYFRDFMSEGQYDFVLNLSAMKHVRSENSGFSMLRMLDTNIVNSVYIHELCDEIGVEKYFAVSTDKATNPAILWGRQSAQWKCVLWPMPMLPQFPEPALLT